MNYLLNSIYDYSGLSQAKKRKTGYFYPAIQIFFINFSK